MRMTATLVALMLCMTWAVAADFTVLDGDTQAVIVVEKDATGETVQAQNDLARCLKVATGRDFEIISERDFDADTSVAAPIYVGRTRAVKRALGADLHRLDRDAFIVAVEPERVMLVGPTPWATYWAVCQFLEDEVGVRWLIPGPLGEDIPQHERIVVSCATATHTPAILSRLWSGAHYGGVWNLRQRIHGRYRFHHNLLNIFNRDMFEEHPEYFPVHGGERYHPGVEDHSWQPCMTDPGGIQVCADAARAAFEANPLLESFSYGINDGHGYCECENCIAVGRPAPEWRGFSGENSYLYYQWLNKVAENLEEDYPDKMLGCLAYSAVILPPPGLKLHRNVIPYLTSNRADYFDPQFRRADETMLDRWSRSTVQMGIYDYAYGMGFAIPRIYNHLFQDAIRFSVAHKVKGFYAEVYPNWGFDGHKLYVMSRILWNPEVDVDAITGDWYARMFRESAGPMGKYFERCERAWREQKTGHGHWAYRLAADPKQFEIFPSDVITECIGYLDDAAAMAESDLVRDRIHFFRKTFEITELLAGNYSAGADLQKLVDEGATIGEMAVAMREMIATIGATDADQFIADRVGDDPIAFHPPKAAWIVPLKSGAATQAKRWMIRHIASGAVADAVASGDLNAEKLRGSIDAQVTEAFGSEGSADYLATVAEIRAIATKVGTAARTDTPVVVDGKLDDAVWQSAGVLADFSAYGQTSASEYVTEVRLVHDGANLFIALDCVQDTADLVTGASPRDGRTWHDDSVEIFMNPGRSDYPWVQFIINARGAFFDQYTANADMTYSECLARNFDCDWATQVLPDRWTAEIRVPLAAIGFDVGNQKTLPINFIRNVQGKDAEISAWFVSLKAHADALSRGWIVLE